jgi:acyl dehydratase
MGEPPQRLEVTAILDPSPAYRGTSHEDATARAMGFRAALMPGVFVYGHAMRLAVQGWGVDWLARGHARVRFRRPVYDGDSLLVERGALEREGAGVSAAVTVTQAETGEVVLDGSFGLADQPPQPPAALPVLPSFEPRLPVRPGAVAAGVQLGSAETVLAREDVARSLADFHETEAVYAERGLIHSGFLIRRTMKDALGNLALPMPVIFAGVEVQNLAAVPVGATGRTSARISRVWEARGRHFFETDEWLLADGRPVARHVRQNLYAMSD